MLKVPKKGTRINFYSEGDWNGVDYQLHISKLPVFFLGKSSLDSLDTFSPAIQNYPIHQKEWIEWILRIMAIPEDPFEAGLDVTDGLANLVVGGFIPLGFAGAGALISHLPSPVKQKWYN